MDKDLLKKALPQGILIGVGAALTIAVVRLMLRGGSFFDHLFSVYGIMTLICVPIGWVVSRYEKEQKKEKQ